MGVSCHVTCHVCQVNIFLHCIWNPIYFAKGKTIEQIIWQQMTSCGCSRCYWCRTVKETAEATTSPSIVTTTSTVSSCACKKTLRNFGTSTVIKSLWHSTTDAFVRPNVTLTAQKTQSITKTGKKIVSNSFQVYLPLLASSQSHIPWSKLHLWAYIHRE